VAKRSSIETVRGLASSVKAAADAMQKTLEEDRAQGIPENLHLFTEEDIALVREAVKVIERPIRIQEGREEAYQNATSEDKLWLFNKGIEDGEISIEVEGHFGHGVVRKLKDHDETMVALIVEDDDGNCYRMKESDLTSVTIKAADEATQKALRDAFSLDVAGSA
jgi:hypothetical protein